MLSPAQTMTENRTNVRLNSCCPPYIGRSGVRTFAHRPYPRHLETQLRLPDGRPVLVRPIRPDDAAGLRAGFRRLTPHDVRMRFLQSLPDLSPAQAAYLTRIDYDRHMALVAIGQDRDGGMDGWGVARLVADAQGAAAELAIVVRSDVQRQGIGSLLIARLLAYAGARGFGQIWGDVLAENQVMLAMAAKRGFRIARSPEGPGVLRISRALQPPIPGAASDPPHRDSCPS